MATRAMGAMAGVDWLKNAVNLGRHNPKAVFGGVALMLVMMIAASLVMALVQGMMVTAMGQGLGVMLLASALMGVVLLVLVAMLMVGFLRLIDAVENRRPARQWTCSAVSAISPRCARSASCCWSRSPSTR